MGRGRAKAKQVKVARQLKYSGGGMDLDQLRAEFGVGTDRHDADEHDPYADSRYSVDGEDDEDDDEDDLDDEDDDFDDEDAFDDEDDLDDEDDDFDEDDDLDEDFDDEDENDPAYPRASGAGLRVSRANGS